MNKRTITIIILSLIAVLLLAGIIYFLFMFRPSGNVAPINQPVSQTTDTGQKNQLSTTPTSMTKQAVVAQETVAQPASSEEVIRYTLVKIASSFAERLGSYSNQSNYGNITDLKNFMSVSMQSWADKYIANAQKTANYTGIYQGVTTRTVTTEVKSFNFTGGTADIIVHTQKTESSGDVSNASTYYQDILISFIKEGGQWKVDNAKWQGKK
jgi:hypothetical protein